MDRSAANVLEALLMTKSVLFLRVLWRLSQSLGFVATNDVESLE